MFASRVKQERRCETSQGSKWSCAYEIDKFLRSEIGKKRRGLRAGKGGWEGKAGSRKDQKRKDGRDEWTDRSDEFDFWRDYVWSKCAHKVLWLLTLVRGVRPEEESGGGGWSGEIKRDKER
jgi:hypothetical protein